MPGWEEATAVQKVSTNTYSCTLHDDWSIGSGGSYNIVSTTQKQHTDMSTQCQMEAM